MADPGPQCSGNTEHGMSTYNGILGAKAPEGSREKAARQG